MSPATIAAPRPLSAGPEAVSPAGVSVVVPVAERPWALDAVYRTYAPAVRGLGEPFEFVFVVSPWARGMTGALRVLQAAGEPVRILEVGQRAGESAMLRAAAPQVRGDVVVTLPPYPRVDPSALPALVRAVRAGADLASARRSRPTAFLNRLQNRAFHLLLRAGSGTRFLDVASGVRAMRRRVLEEVPLYGDFFRFLPLLTEAEGFRVQEVEVPRHPDDARTRVYAPGIYVRRLLDLLAFFFVTRFTQKPLRFFGLLGSVFAAAGGLVLVILLVQRLGGRDLADRPMLVLGVLLFVVGVQAVSIGLVGEIIVHFGASERRLYRVAEDGDPVPSPPDPAAPA